MAIAKISRPRRAGPTLRYLTGLVDHAGRPRGVVSVVASTVGKTPEEATRFLGAVAALRPRLRRHLYHVSISVPQDDRALSEADWAAIGRAWCEGMEIENFLIVLHDAHIHILGSRIRLDGTAAPDQWDYRRSELLLRTIETQFGLAPTRSSHLVDRARGVPHQRARTLKELHAVRRDGRSHKDFIRRSIDDALAEGIDAAQLRTVLAEAGIEMVLEQAADGAGSVLFGFQGRLYGARSLGQGYSLTNLLVRGLQLGGPQNARAQLPTPPWALDEGVSRKKPQGVGHHEDALRRLRGFGREAHQVIDRYRARDVAQHPSPSSDPSGAGPEPEEKPPDVS